MDKKLERDWGDLIEKDVLKMFPAKFAKIQRLP